MTATSLSLLLCGGLSLVLAAYPSHYEVGYGFVNHGSIGPHGHYLPGSAKVKVHKDPFQSTYSVDEEGPTHYKYVRHSTVGDPILNHHHHHAFPVHHGGIGAAVPVHGGAVIGGAGLAIAAPYAGFGVGYGHRGGHYGGLGVGGYGGLGGHAGYGGLGGHAGHAGYAGLGGHYGGHIGGGGHHAAHHVGHAGHGFHGQYYG